jgi:hypothetical protein
MIEQGIDDHHVFPQAYLEATAPELSARLRDCVLNRTLIDRATNQRINKRPPSSYLADIQQKVQGALPVLLASHLLPTGSTNPLLDDDFEGFLQWRQDAIWQRIQHATGVDAASDLIEDTEELSASA